jgi:hypothetical protein
MGRLNSFRFVVALVLALGWSLPAGFAGAEELVESGTFHVEIYRVSFMGSAAHGKGTLRHGGKTYKFKARGLGAGGFGASKTTVNGTVYNLKKREDFVGTYANLRSGVAVGDKNMGKSLWVENQNRVRLKGEPDMEGAQLNLGADGVVVTWDD